MFDTELEGERVLCSLPLELFGHGTVEVEILCTQEGCTLSTKADLPVRSITAGPLEHTASLYELVERFYVQLGNAQSARETLRIRDFSFPPFDPRHWALNDGSDIKTPSIDEQQQQKEPKYLLAMFDYESQEKGKLTFKKNALFEFIVDCGDGWIRVRDMSNTFGLVPSNYVKEQQL